MTRFESRRILSIGVAALLSLAACTSAATPAPTPAPAKSASPTVAASPTATALPGTKTFSVGLPTPSVANSLLRAAIDSLNKSGYTVKVESINTPDLVVAGVTNNTLQFGDGSINSVMAAIEKGADMRVIVDRTGNEWSLYTTKAITKCADLNGVRLGVTSPTSAVTMMLKAWIAKTCAGTTPQYLTIASSGDRAAALVAGQLDASPLQLADGLPLINSAANAGKFAVLVNFQQQLPEVLISSVYVGTAFARENPGTVLELIKAMLTQARKVADDPTYLKTVATQFVPGIDQSTLDPVLKAYMDYKLFDVNGGLTQSKLEYNAKFYGPAPDGAGSTKAVLAVNTWADLTYLNMALTALGKR